MRNESLITISERTGYSASTVSRVLSGQANKYRISDKAVEIITSEAKRCDFTPSLLAKGLRLNKTNTIGLLIPCVDNPFFANIASKIIVEAKSYGYTIISVDTLEDENNERDGLASLISRKVDGIIAVPCGKNPEKFEKLEAQGVPIVLIDRYYQDTKLSYVCTNNYRGAMDGTRYLVSQGHKHIACIQGPSHMMSVIERARGYYDALKEAGLEHNAHISGKDFSIQNGYLETNLLLASGHRPTAIFTMSNTILMGAIKAIKEAGLRIPDDISVLSFDNNVFLDFLDPAITCIGQPVQEIGILAVKLVVQRIDAQDMSNPQIQLPPRLIIRDSIKAI